MYVCIEGIALEHFSETDQEKYSYSLHICTSHAMFHSFLSYNSKQDAATTAAHRKKSFICWKKKVLGSGLSNIWDNTYDCADNYICDTSLYWLSILP